MKRIVLLTLVTCLLSAGPSFALDPTKAAAVKQALTRVPAAEMPAKAAELVKTAKKEHRGAATVITVRTALELNPALAPILVGTIAKTVPEMAGIAAGAAAELEPTLAEAIAQAAALAASSQACSIVAAVCRVVPQAYGQVAEAVAQVLPGTGREVLEGVASALPNLKTGIDAALAGNGRTPVSVGAVLDSARPALVSAPAGAFPTMGAVPRGPAIEPPLIPPSGTATNTDPSKSGPVPRGGRNYASP